MPGSELAGSVDGRRHVVSTWSVVIVVVVVVVVVVVSSWVWPRMRSRSSALPSGSTSSTWCSSQSSALDLRIWAVQLGHEVVALVGLAHLVRLLLDLHGHPLVLGGEVAVVGVERLGGGDGAQREVDLDGLLGRALQALDERVGVLAGDREPLLDVDALRLQLAHGALDAALQVALHERLGRLDRRSAR